MMAGQPQVIRDTVIRSITLCYLGDGDSWSLDFTVTAFVLTEGVLPEGDRSFCGSSDSVLPILSEQVARYCHLCPGFDFDSTATCC